VLTAGFITLNTMTPKEKAQEIHDKIHDCGEMMYFKDVKNCALITVDEILLATSVITVRQSHHRAEEIEYSDYWQEVKVEIEKL
jgi:hypothetical protein